MLLFNSIFEIDAYENYNEEWVFSRELLKMRNAGVVLISQYDFPEHSFGRFSSRLPAKTAACVVNFYLKSHFDCTSDDFVFDDYDFTGEFTATWSA